MKRVARSVAATLAVMIALAVMGSVPAGAHCEICNYGNGEDTPYCDSFFVGWAECWVDRHNCRILWFFDCDYRCAGTGQCRTWPG